MSHCTGQCLDLIKPWLVKNHEMQGETHDQGEIQNALEHLDSVACDCVLVLMVVKCYSFNDSNIELCQ